MECEVADKDLHGKKGPDSSSQSSNGLTINREELRKAHFRVALIGFAIFAAQVVYLLLVETMVQQGLRKPAEEHDRTLMIIRLVLYGLVIPQYLLLRWLGHLARAGKGFYRKSRPTSFSPVVRGFLSGGIFRYAACNFAGIAGLLLYILSGNRLEFYPMFALAIILWITTWQPWSLWEEWARIMEVKEIERGPTVGD